MPLALPSIPVLDIPSSEAARARQNTLTKPPGSLGRLEEIAIRIAGIQGSATPTIQRRYAVIAAADHGVASEGVSQYPQSVTGQMVLNFLAGGAAINALARDAGVELVIVDAGVASELPDDNRIRRVALAKGTANFLQRPAMTRAHAEAIIKSGVGLGIELSANGRTAVVPGEMGIANTTAAAAVTAAISGRSPAEVTGHGTGLNDESLSRKISIVKQAIELHSLDRSDGIAVLSSVGGYEIGFLVGLMFGVASKRGIVVIDGFISTAAALLAATIEPRVKEFMFAGHRSTEPGHSIALAHLGLEPLLDLGMRLGEGTGAVIALKVIESSLAVHNGMATFADAGVSGPAGEETGDTS